MAFLPTRWISRQSPEGDKDGGGEDDANGNKGDDDDGNDDGDDGDTGNIGNHGDGNDDRDDGDGHNYTIWMVSTIT